MNSVLPVAPPVRLHGALSLSLDEGVAVRIQDIEQGRGEFAQPGIPDLALRFAMNSYRVTGRVGGARVNARKTPGQFHVTAPMTDSSVVIDQPKRIRLVSLPVGIVGRAWGQLDIEPIELGRLHSEAHSSTLVLGIVERLSDQAECGAPLGRLYADAAILMLLAEIAQLARRPVRMQPGGLAAWQVRRASDYMSANLSRDITLSETAALVGLSTFHFCRAFRQSTGLPPYRWLLQRRVEKACELLASTDHPVTEIAAAVGYDDSGQLAALFRKTLGIAPSQYRRARRA